LLIDQLAIIALRHIDSVPGWSAHNFIQLSLNHGLGKQASQCWAEALNWLISKNLVAQPNLNNSSPGTIFVHVSVNLYWNLDLRLLRHLNAFSLTCTQGLRG
jgi:hypothetical protein